MLIASHINYCLTLDFHFPEFILTIKNKGLYDKKNDYLITYVYPQNAPKYLIL